jgi:hypothetical protein
MKRHITTDEILEWNGDGGEFELADYIGAILNGKWSIDEARAELNDYHNIVRDED